MRAQVLRLRGPERLRAAAEPELLPALQRAQQLLELLPAAAQARERAQRQEQVQRQVREQLPEQDGPGRFLSRFRRPRWLLLRRKRLSGPHRWLAKDIP